MRSRNPKGNFFRFGTCLHRPSEKLSAGPENRNTKDPGQPEKVKGLPAITHRPRHFHPLYKSCLFVYNGKDDLGDSFRYGRYYTTFW